MKILLINKYYYIKGGCETYMFNLQKLLEARGHQVIVFAQEDSRNLRAPLGSRFAAAVDFNSGWTGKLAWVGRQLWSWGASRPLARLIEKEQPDIVHCHNIYHQLGPHILKVCKKYHLPVVMTLHDFKLICPNYQLFTQGKICERCRAHHYGQCIKHRCVKNSLAGSWLGALEMYWHQVLFKTYLKNVDRFIAPSRFMLEKMVAWGWPREKFVHLANFVEAGDEEGNIAKQIYALYFGRLSHEKGVDILIKAWAKVVTPAGVQSRLTGVSYGQGTSHTIHAPRLIIAGAGPQEKEYRALIRRLKLTKSVKMVGFKTGAALQKLIQNAAINIIPSRIYENCPLSLLEAGALGTPTLGAAIGGIPELIRPGINGELFAAGNPVDLAAKISELLSQPQRLAAMGVAAGDLTQTYFNSEQHWAGVESVYSALLPEKLKSKF